MINISKEDLTEEEFEDIIASRGFQKMLLYQRLADSIEVLRAHDRIYDSMVRAITNQHSEIDSVDAVIEVLSLLEREVATYTEPLTADNDDEPQLSTDSVSSHDDVTTTSHATVDANPEETVQAFLENRLEECDQIEMKANEIASAIGLESTHVGGILGRWRHSEDAPFTITASEESSGGNVWMIARVE